MTGNNTPSILDFLHTFPDLSLQSHGGLSLADFRLDNIQALLAALGNPEKDFPSLHVAGTNGKGSLVAFCSSVLEAAGYKVGRYTSPHFLRPLEGIAVNGRSLSPQQAEELFMKLRQHLQGIPDLTRFELLTALAFLHFSLSIVDIAVFEVGLGGGQDATNIISPLISIITPIDLEHQAILGDTLEEISSHKAGIIKPNTPVIVAQQTTEVRKVLHAVAAERKAPWFELGRDYQFENRSYDLTGQLLEVWQARNPEVRTNLRIGLHGDHQIQNAALAFAALQIVRDQGFDLDSQAIRSGFENARWPGRFEVFKGTPTIVLDAAHTPAATQALAASLDDYFPGKSIVAIFGVSADKRLADILAPLENRFSSLLITQSGHPRAQKADGLTRELESLGWAAAAHPDPADALERAKELCAEDGLLIVFGSVFLVEKMRDLLKRKSEAL